MESEFAGCPCLVTECVCTDGLPEPENGEAELRQTGKCSRASKVRGHNGDTIRCFLPLLVRHPVRSRSCGFRFSHPAFTAVTRVQIPSGTPNLFNHLRGAAGPRSSPRPAK